MRAGSWLWELRVKVSEGVGLRGAGSGRAARHPKLAGALCELGKAAPLCSFQPPLAPQPGRHFHQCTACPTSGGRPTASLQERAVRPGAPICPSLSHLCGPRGFTGAPALPQAGPKKRVPRPWRPSRTSTRRWGCQRTWWPCCPSQVPLRAPPLPKPRPVKAPPLPEPRSAPSPESWEVPAGGSPVSQGCVGRAGGEWGCRPQRVPWHGEGLQEAGCSPSQTSLSGPSVFLQMCAPRGTGTHPEGSGEPVWPFPGRGQGSTSLPLSRACVPGPPPSHLLRSAHADPPASLVLPGYSLLCLQPALTHDLFQGSLS